MRVGLLLSTCIPIVTALESITPTANVRYGEVDSALESKMRLMSQYAASAYCVTRYNATSTDVICVKGVCPDIISADTTNFLHQVSFISNRKAFVSVDPTNKLIVLAFKGTVAVTDWMANINIVRRKCVFGLGCLVHAGFNSVWIKIHSELTSGIRQAMAENPTYKVVLTGHSHGGAVATVAAANLRMEGIPCELFTFGSPRVFNSIGADYVSKQPGGNIRVTNWDDPFPRFPPIYMGYRHTSPEYWLSVDHTTRTDNCASEIAVCTGDENLDCNAKFDNLHTDAHDHYFEDITACDGVKDLGMKKRDTDLMEAQNKWSEFAVADSEHLGRSQGTGGY